MRNIIRISAFLALFAAAPAFAGGTADQQATYLKEFAGENVPQACVAITEPHALFDPTALKTTADEVVQAIIDNGVFCVNVLRDDQAFISDCFAGRAKTTDGDKFSCTEWTTLATGAPRAADVMAAEEPMLAPLLEAAE